MEDLFVDYETALALKELGFDEECIYDYFEFNNLNQTLERDIQPMLTQDDIDEYSKENSLYPFWSCSAPFYQQAFRYFREKYKLGAIVSQFGWGIENEFGQIIHNISDRENPLCYEEAQFGCLKKLIEIAKSKGFPKVDETIDGTKI